ncbi:MAG: hypothetical protein OXI18_08855 [bacterium]|nr:hypothetical protein [bacterium]
MQTPSHDTSGNTDGDPGHATIVRRVQRHLVDIGGGVELSCDDALLVLRQSGLWIDEVWRPGMEKRDSYLEIRVDGPGALFGHGTLVGTTRDLPRWVRCLVGLEPGPLAEVDEPGVPQPPLPGFG